MKKTISVSILVLLAIFCFIPIFNLDNDRQNEEKDKIIYQEGYIQGKDIYEQFEFVGERQNTTFFGGNGITNIYCQQTTNGGWVAWVGRRYIYTDEDVGADRILNKAIGKFVIPLQGLGS